MTSPLQSPGDKMKKVLCWVTETLKDHPEKKRDAVFKDAQIRFDLSPMECEFLNKHFVPEACDKSK